MIRLSCPEAPRPAGAPRQIEPLATLPVFHKLSGRRAVVAGATEGALWKAELLAAAGASVTVLAGTAEGAHRFAVLSGELAEGLLSVVARPWLPSDLAGAAIAVADLAQEEAAAFAVAARAAGVAANLVDRPELSDFQFGAIVNRSPLVVSISTDGGAPVFAQALRLKLESLLPKGLGAWAEAAKSWRPALQRRALPFGERRRFWERFSALAWREAERPPSAADREALFRTLRPGAAERRRLEQRPAGRVVLVGAGPGDPELLTLKAAQALQSATVIFYEQGIAHPILALARREARRVALPQGPGAADRERRDGAGQAMAALARRGDYVVRLKVGQGQFAGSELSALRRAGVAVETIPGLAAKPSGPVGLAAEDRRVA